MSHLPNIGLKQFKRGQGLAAADLNDNFNALLGLIETAMHAALSPDPVAVQNEIGLDVLDQRVRGLEHLTSMHARQRNEREWAPMAHLGAVVVQLNALRRDLQASVARLDAACASVSAMHDDMGRRLQRLEQRPEAATKEEHDELFKEHKRIAEKEHMLLAQVNATRQEVGLLRKMAMGRARQRNEVEYATMAHLGAVVVMVKDLAKRLPPVEEAPP